MVHERLIDENASVNWGLVQTPGILKDLTDRDSEFDRAVAELVGENRMTIPPDLVG
jgi:hypothetical protein